MINNNNEYTNKGNFEICGKSVEIIVFAGKNDVEFLMINKVIRGMENDKLGYLAPDYYDHSMMQNEINNSIINGKIKLINFSNMKSLLVDIEDVV